MYLWSVVRHEIYRGKKQKYVVSSYNTYEAALTAFKRKLAFKTAKTDYELVHNEYSLPG